MGTETQEAAARLIANFEALEKSYVHSANARRSEAAFAGRKGDGRSKPKVARLYREAQEFAAKAEKCRAAIIGLKGAK